MQTIMNSCVKSLSLIAAAAILTLASPSFAFRNIKEGTPAPDFQLKDIDGNTYALSGLRGKAVILLYLRIGQERSNNALVRLAHLARTPQVPPVRILAITKDTSNKSQIKRLQDSLDLPFPILLDDQAQVYTAYGVFVFPSTALIDRDGIFRYHYGGLRDGYEDDLYDQLRLTSGMITAAELANEKQEDVTGMNERQRKAVHHINLGRKLKDRGLEDRAFQEFKTAAGLDPENPEVLIEIGFYQLEHAEVTAAVKNFSAALKQNARSSDAKLGLGKAYRLQGKIDESLAILKSALLLCPDSASIHFELGQIYESQDNLPEALKQYKEAAQCSINFKK